MHQVHSQWYVGVQYTEKKIYVPRLTLLDYRFNRIIFEVRTPFELDVNDNFDYVCDMIWHIPRHTWYIFCVNLIYLLILDIFWALFSTIWVVECMNVCWVFCSNVKNQYCFEMIRRSPNNFWNKFSEICFESKIEM